MVLTDIPQMTSKFVEIAPPSDRQGYCIHSAAIPPFADQQAIRRRRHGEAPGLDLEYARSLVFFTWAGFEEMDEVTGSGSAELNDDGTISIEFAYHLGDEAELKAHRW